MSIDRGERSYSQFSGNMWLGRQVNVVRNQKKTKHLSLTGEEYAENRENNGNNIQEMNKLITSKKMVQHRELFKKIYK